MPRRKSSVKTKSVTHRLKSLGAVDIHFHGAFGIDLMTAPPRQLNELAVRLGKEGVAAFCPTTLSVPFAQLRDSVGRLGAWIRSKPAAGAVPLGIHLEGPYIHPGACGAHPPEAIRSFQLKELEELWEVSRHTLKILTISPERLSAGERKRLTAWSRDRGVVLSLGHSRATLSQAREAFDSGFTGVTHAWNALSFHHRDPGPLGAALGRRDVTLEVILDQIHVSPSVVRWTRDLHGNARLCYVSDCAPAAATRPGSWHSFGHLRTRLHQGACRLSDGHLAGGGILLPEAFRRWVEQEARNSVRSRRSVLRREMESITLAPLRYLGLSGRAAWFRKNRPVEWMIHASGGIHFQPLF